jgi:hypothetical protein
MAEPFSACAVAKFGVDVLITVSTVCLAAASASVAQQSFKPSIAAPPLNYSAAHSSVCNKQGPTTQPIVSHATDMVLYKHMIPDNLSGLSSTHEDVIRDLQLSVQNLRNTTDLQAQKITTQAAHIEQLTLNTTTQQGLMQKQTNLTMRQQRVIDKKTNQTMRLKLKIFHQKGFIKKQANLTMRQQRVIQKKTNQTRRLKQKIFQQKGFIKNQTQTMRNLTNTSQELNSCTMCAMNTGTLLLQGASKIWLACSVAGVAIVGGIYAACLAAVDVHKRNHGQNWLVLTTFATTLFKPLMTQLWCMLGFCGQYDQNTIIAGYSDGMLTVGWLTVGLMIFFFIWWAICWLRSYRRNRMMRIRGHALDIWSTLLDSTQRQEHCDSVKLALQWKKLILQTSYNVHIMDIFITRWKPEASWTDEADKTALQLSDHVSSVLQKRFVCTDDMSNDQKSECLMFAMKRSLVIKTLCHLWDERHRIRATTTNIERAGWQKLAGVLATLDTDAKEETENLQRQHLVHTLAAAKAAIDAANAVALAAPQA